MIVDGIGSATGIGPDLIPTTTTHPRTHARNTRTLAVLHTHTTPINITCVFEVCFACLSDRDRKQRSPAVPLRLTQSRLEIESNQKGGRGGKGKGKGKQREMERERGGKERWGEGREGRITIRQFPITGVAARLLLLVQDFARRCRHELGFRSAADFLPSYLMLAYTCFALGALVSLGALARGEESSNAINLAILACKLAACAAPKTIEPLCCTSPEFTNLPRMRVRKLYFAVAFAVAVAALCTGTSHCVFSF